MLWIWIQTYLWISSSSAAPTFKLANKYKEILYLKEASSTVIEIPFFGSPQPKAKWTFDRGPMPDNRRVTVETIRNMTCVRLTRVERDESGDYTLNLQNDKGKTSVTITVVVMSKYWL